MSTTDLSIDQIIGLNRVGVVAAYRVWMQLEQEQRETAATALLDGSTPQEILEDVVMLVTAMGFDVQLPNEPVVADEDPTGYGMYL